MAKKPNQDSWEVWKDQPKKKRRGNPNWAKFALGALAEGVPCAWELELKKRKLTEEEAEGSRAMREWARRNFRQRFVPEDLLLRWGLVEGRDL